MSQLELAKIIKQYRQNGDSWKDIGNKLGQHPEACRSILRRYESDLTGDIGILSILDKEVNLDELVVYRKAQKLVAKFNEMERREGYGEYFHISDLHGCFADRQALKIAILDAKKKGIRKAIVNGDLFNLDSASPFPKEKDSIIKLEKQAVKDILIVLANEFERVYIIEGNHDKRIKRLLYKRLDNGIKDLFHNIDVIQIVIDELKDEEGIENIYYTWCNELKLGNVIFAHPDYFTNVAGKTVLAMIDTYMIQHKNLSAVVIGHTHYDMKKMYRGVAAFEAGCMCFEPDYRHGARKRNDLWTVAYGIFRINQDGNIDYNNSHIIQVANDMD